MRTVTLDEMRLLVLRTRDPFTVSPVGVVVGPNRQIEASCLVTRGGPKAVEFVGRVLLDACYARTPRWRDEPFDVLSECAEAAALRGAFGDVCGHLRLAEEPAEPLAEVAA
ncbi:MAG: hypothetical protein JWO31_334 [Phycisphaerales bacterium]|nr:hypothetical protein [Phycisphaerales bacterium]